MEGTNHREGSKWEHQHSTSCPGLIRCQCQALKPPAANWTLSLVPPGVAWSRPNQGGAGREEAMVGCGGLSAVHREVVISYSSVLKCLQWQQGGRVVSRRQEWLEHSPPEGGGKGAAESCHLSCNFTDLGHR